MENFVTALQVHLLHVCGRNVAIPLIQRATDGANNTKIESMDCTRIIFKGIVTLTLYKSDLQEPQV